MRPIFTAIFLLFSSFASPAMQQSYTSPLNTAKTALSGGFAGFVGTLTLFPLDCAKTVKQANPSQYKTVFNALTSKVKDDGIAGLYRGCITASLSAIPSSAIYFGFYEGTKNLLKSQFGDEEKKEWTVGRRLRLHACAAAVGNCASSVIFVPKEYIKQTLQIATKASGANINYSSVIKYVGERAQRAGRENENIILVASLLVGLCSALFA